MFKISPVQDEQTAKKYAEICGVKIQPFAFMYAMTDRDSGALMGISQFEITNGGGYIYDIKEIPGADDFEAMFILGRQTFVFTQSTYCLWN